MNLVTGLLILPLWSTKSGIHIYHTKMQNLYKKGLDLSKGGPQQFPISIWAAHHCKAKRASIHE